MTGNYALILAGGQSARMGADKAEIELGGARLIDHMITLARAQRLTPIISASHDYGTGAEFVADHSDAPRGPAAALYSACLAYPKAFGFLSMAVDTPGAPHNLFAKLYHDGYSAIAQDRTGVHPTFGWWRSADLRAAFNGLDGQSSVSLKALARACNAQNVDWPLDAKGQSLFFNINTANDLNQYLTR